MTNGNLDPAMLQMFINYISERDAIYEKKEKGEPWPWTNDPILQEWKFTNVYRDRDRTTKHFVDTYYKPNWDAPAEQVALNCAVFRWFGTTEFIDRIGWQTSFDAAKLLTAVDHVFASGGKVFTGAYKVSNGGKSMPKQDYVVKFILKGYAQSLDEVLDACATNRKQEVHETLKTMEGFGPFMSKEVIEDLCLTRLLQDPEDADTFTPIGPGARRGLTRLYGDNPSDRILLKRIARLQQEIQMHCGLPMTAHDVQFNCCEFEKYLKVHLDEGRPRSKYVPPEPEPKGFFLPDGSPNPALLA